MHAHPGIVDYYISKHLGGADGRVAGLSTTISWARVPPYTRSSVPKVLGQDLSPKYALR